MKRCFCALVGNVCKDTLEILGTACLERQEFYSQRSSRLFDVIKGYGVVWAFWIREDCYGLDRRDKLPEEFEILAEDFRTNGIGKPGDIPAGSSNACGESLFNGI